MKLFQLVAALAVTALTAATSLGAGVEAPARRASLARNEVNDLSSRDLKHVPGDVSHYSQILDYYKEALGRRDEDRQRGCSSCADWIKQCKKTQCARPWAPECQWDCQNKLCKDGPSECHKGGACVPKYCGAQANEPTSSGSSEALLVRQDDVHKTDTESKAACGLCDDWMKGCKKQCTRPWTPECRWHCLINLCHFGPSECHAGGSCGLQSRCDVGLVGVTTSGSSTAPQARDNGDGWDKEECDEYVTGCVNAFCRNPLHNGPNCVQVCHSALCQTQPACCKAA
ncbi:hypothetical protein P171DRAFT_136368 [Karstenula rhodostoma CBS 690.94]|uniref:Uncharacterized protein n=1 Tax=Karstenula rhodostoma CBS 690.94 TaxID=1392251 RepID=A0A9P4PRZ8_9PLEO|nr:hypothetical protein P171DRAFT_136368 [Karstenula rhodostoma CBS 690.94]